MKLTAGMLKEYISQLPADAEIRIVNLKSDGNVITTTNFTITSVEAAANERKKFINGKVISQGNDSHLTFLVYSASTHSNTQEVEKNEVDNSTSES
jgi:hypothetical protein